jgi:hypothetical protein
VACASQKQSHRARAEDLYISPLFKRSRRYCELTCDVWAILSAKHGLVMPETVIEPYNKALYEMKISERRTWGDLVLSQFRMRFRGYAWELVTLVMLAGEQYRAPFEQAKTFQIEAPLAGMFIGQQLQFLNRSLAQLERSRPRTIRKGVGARE